MNREKKMRISKKTILLSGTRFYRLKILDPQNQVFLVKPIKINK